MRELWTRWIEGWEHYRSTQCNWSEAGEHVIADVEVQATGAQQRSRGDLEPMPGVDIRDGKVIRWSLFKERAEALKAVGLEE